MKLSSSIQEPGHSTLRTDSRRPPSRDELAAATFTRLRESNDGNANLWLVRSGERLVVVKDYAGKSWWSRRLGRIQIAREDRIYRRLGAMDGIPRYLGRIDALALAVEWQSGVLLADAADRVSHGADYVRLLGEIVARMHRAGVVHLDLRNNKNVVLRDDGQPMVIDFAGSIGFRSGSLAHRVLFPLLQLSDLSACVKWKQTLHAGPLTAAEQALIRRHQRLRRYWPFNRKHPER